MEKIKSWFKSSVTIFWARLQMFVGASVGFLAALDFAPIAGILPPKWSAVVIFASGVVTEIARRRTL